jgi:hypothetical protein
MSGALALASVTAVLKDLLENGLAERGVTGELGGDTTVSALPPDRIASGTDERAQLNLFLYHVTPHTAVRALGGRAPGGRAPGGLAPGGLALDLHYLLSVYGAHDFQTEILLGHALQLLHANPVLGREHIRSSLRSLSAPHEGRVLSPAVAALGASGLADTVESLRIVPEFLTTEEMSRLWSAFQARYRPSATFRVSAAVIDQAVAV